VGCYCPSAGFEAADFESDDGFLQGDLTGVLHKAGPVFDAFDI